jgi:hypothetical protein
MRGVAGEIFGWVLVAAFVLALVAVILMANAWLAWADREDRRAKGECKPEAGESPR